MGPLVDTRINDWLDKLDEKFVRTGKAFDFTWWAM